jgi:hypothetical protein
MSENLNEMYQSLDKRIGEPAFAANYRFVSRKTVHIQMARNVLINGR